MNQLMCTPVQTEISLDAYCISPNKSPGAFQFTHSANDILETNPSEEMKKCLWSKASFENLAIFSLEKWIGAFIRKGMFIRRKTVYAF